MKAAQFIPLAIMLSMAGVLLSVALQARLADLTYLLRHPGLLVRSVLAMNVLMPLLAVTMALAFQLERTVALALIAMALSPVPPILPSTELKAGGSRAYTLGLAVASCTLAIVFVPLAMGFLGRLAGHAIEVSPASVARIVVLWMLLPLVAGTAIRALAPRAAAASARPLALASTVLLLAAAAPVLLKEWRPLVALLSDSSAVAIVVFALAGLALGHILGGPDPQERTVLALSSSARHPGVAMVMLHATNGSDQHALVTAVLLVLLVAVVVVQPYVRWAGRAAVRPGSGHA